MVTQKQLKGFDWRALMGLRFYHTNEITRHIWSRNKRYIHIHMSKFICVVKTFGQCAPIRQLVPWALPNKRIEFSYLRFSTLLKISLISTKLPSPNKMTLRQRTKILCLIKHKICLQVFNYELTSSFFIFFELRVKFNFFFFKPIDWSA